jgi:hypothetical protein
MNQFESQSVPAAESSRAIFKPFITRAGSFFFLFLITAGTCLAGTSVEEVRNHLTSRIELQASEFANLENGRLISKLLPAGNKREVAVFGLIPLKIQPDEAFQAFQESLVRQNGKTNGDFGYFSSTPRPEDLQNLILEDGDIEDLKKCQIGSCNVKLSAAMIERFQRELDWNAPDYAKRANDLYRQIILDYVRDYLARGDAALLEYHDKREPIDLADENRSLLKQAIMVNDFAPELARHLQDFPRSPAPNISQSITWAKVKFGLKPVIIITHNVDYRIDSAEGPAQIYSVAKQIYANHYFDSSFGLTAIIKSPNSAGTDSYLMYANYSRSDALGGIIGKFARGKVEKEAIDKLELLLQTTKYIAESKLRNLDESAALTTQSVLGDNYFLWLLTLPFAALALWIGIRKSSKS